MTLKEREKLAQGGVLGHNCPSTLSDLYPPQRLILISLRGEGGEGRLEVPGPGGAHGGCELSNVSAKNQSQVLLH